MGWRRLPARSPPPRGSRATASEDRHFSPRGRSLPARHSCDTGNGAVSRDAAAASDDVRYRVRLAAEVNVPMGNIDMSLDTGVARARSALHAVERAGQDDQGTCRNPYRPGPCRTRLPLPPRGGCTRCPRSWRWGWWRVTVGPSRPRPAVESRITAPAVATATQSVRRPMGMCV